MRVLVDMNLSPRWVTVLAVANVSAAHWSNIGLASASDREIMAHAREGNWVVLTRDLDFRPSWRPSGKWNLNWKWERW